MEQTTGNGRSQRDRQDQRAIRHLPATKAHEATMLASKLLKLRMRNIGIAIQAECTWHAVVSEPIKFGGYRHTILTLFDVFRHLGPPKATYRCAYVAVTPELAQVIESSRQMCLGQ